jgi:hypothetical protein
MKYAGNSRGEGRKQGRDGEQGRARKEAHWREECVGRREHPIGVVIRQGRFYASECMG